MEHKIAILPLINVPCKQLKDAAAKVYLTGLPSIISEHYEHHSPHEFQQAIEAMQRMRDSATASEIDDSKLEKLWRYYTQLDLFELHFPAATLDHQDLLTFAWLDAFDSADASLQQAVAFEKAATLFNLGAMLSQLAQQKFVQAAANDADGVKLAFNQLQSAAYMFDYVCQNFLHAPSRDLSKQVTTLLHKLTLAQAQEVFVYKAWRDHYEKVGYGTDQLAGKAILGKLAQGASTMFEALVAMLKEPVVTGGDKLIESYVPAEWSTALNLKQHYYSTLAQYHKSVSCEQQSKYGEMVAHAQLADTEFKECARLGKDLDAAMARKLSAGQSYLSMLSGSVKSPTSSASLPPLSVKDQLASLQVLVSERLRKCLKENDVIYHDTVPVVAALAPLPATVVAKPVRFVETYPALADVSTQADLFAKIIPIKTLEQESLFSVQKDDYMREFKARVTEADDELASALSSMYITQFLGQFQQNEQSSALVPEAALNLSAMLAVQEEEPIQVQLDKLKSVSDGVKQQLANTGSFYGQDFDQYHQFLRQYGELAQGRQVDPSTFWQQYNTDLKKLQDDYARGQAGDVKLTQTWSSIESDVKLLLGGESALKNAFANASNTQMSNQVNLLDMPIETVHSDGKPVADEIKKRMAQLQLLRKERATTLEALRKRMQDETPEGDGALSNKLLLNKKHEEDVMRAELQKYKQEYGTVLAGNAEYQRRVLAELSGTDSSSGLVQKLKDSQQYADQARKKTCRDQLAARLQKAHVEYQNVRGNVGKGVDYYQRIGRAVEQIAPHGHRMLAQRQQERTQIQASMADRMTDILQQRLNQMNMRQ